MNKVKVIIPLLLLAALPPTGFSEEKSENKNITIIQGQSTADGKSQVTERLLEECVGSLPDPASLDPIVSSSSEYLKEINGDPAKNDFVKIYTATLEINYIVKQKALIVVTTNSVQGQEPVMKVLEKTLTQSKKFSSNSADGDLYAGRSRRQYYFSTPEGATKDVRNRASAWIKQQSAVLCK
ncbi:MAG: hypothetical protein JW863_18975 [Chitinispirillaceae bacterium]|nr:hypothetical protein [Chitinispirillaceae bacterium]